jgi:hypothetical protein
MIGRKFACFEFAGSVMRDCCNIEHWRVELGSVRLLKEDLDRSGLRSKLRVFSNGSRSGEKSFWRCAPLDQITAPDFQQTGNE